MCYIYISFMYLLSNKYFHGKSKISILYPQNIYMQSCNTCQSQSPNTFLEKIVIYIVKNYFQTKFLKLIYYSTTYLSIIYKKHQPGKHTSLVHILINIKYVLNNTDHEGDIYGSTGDTVSQYTVQYSHNLLCQKCTIALPTLIHTGDTKLSIFFNISYCYC